MPPYDCDAASRRGRRFERCDAVCRRGRRAKRRGLSPNCSDACTWRRRAFVVDRMSRGPTPFQTLSADLLIFFSPKNAIFGSFLARVAPGGSVVPKPLLYFVGHLALNILFFGWRESTHTGGSYGNSKVTNFHIFWILWPTFTLCYPSTSYRLPRITTM